MDQIAIKLSKELEEMQRQMHRMLANFTDILGAGLLMKDGDGVWAPPTDIFEDHREYTMVIDLAGVKKEEIEITIAGDLVKVKGIRRPQVFKNKRLLQLEISHGKFERIFKLPDSLIVESVSATYNNGYLSIILPKKFF